MKQNIMIVVFIFIYFLTPIFGFAQNICARNVTYARLTIPQSSESYPTFVDIIVNTDDSIKAETSSLDRFLNSVITQSDYVYPCWSISTEPYRALWGSSKNIYDAMIQFQQEFGKKSEELSSLYFIKTDDGASIGIEYYDIAGIFYVKELTEYKNKPNCSISLDIEQFPQVRKIWYPVSVVSYSKSGRVPLY